MGIFILYAILVVISVWDGITYRIPNAFTITGTIIGLGVAFWDNGLDGLKQSIIGLAVTVLVFFLIWCLFEILHMPAIGGGDMKLFMMISVYLGFYQTLGIFLLSIFLMSFIFIFITHPKKIKAMFDQLVYLFMYFIPSKTEKNLKKFAFSIPITIAVFLQLHVF